MEEAFGQATSTVSGSFDAVHSASTTKVVCPLLTISRSPTYIVPGMAVSGGLGVEPPQSGTLRRRRALAITETELKLIAALASMGLSSQPRKG